MIAAALILLAAAAAAAAATPGVLDRDLGCAPVQNPAASGACIPTTVAAYDGWSAWSRADTATGDYALIARTPSGVIAALDVAESAAPFDVELGPSHGRVAAVYSRCADPADGTGCAIAYVPLGVSGARERMLAVPGGGSLHEPAIFNDTLAFLRRDPSGGTENDGIAGAHPDTLMEWAIGSAGVQTLAFPRRLGQPGVIGGLTLQGREVAYTTSGPTATRPVTVQALWTQRPGATPSLIDAQTSGQGNICTTTFLSPTFAGAGTLYAFLRGCQQGLGDRWTRYGLGAHPTAARAQVSFGNDDNADVTAVVPVGSGVEWARDSGLYWLGSVQWSRVARYNPTAALYPGCTPTSC